MPGKKPTVAVRIPQEQLDLIREICRKTRQSQSEWLQAAIANYLDQTPDLSAVSEVYPGAEQVQTLFTELQTLKARVEALEEQTRFAEVNTIEPDQDQVIGEGELLTLKDVCDRYSLNYSNFSARAKRKGLSLVDNLSQETGQRWHLVGKLYKVEG